LGVPFLGPYTASKAALSGWTRSLQAEWEGTGIVVSEYLPGNVATGARAESELGVIDGEVFEDPNQHPLMRALARPQRPEKIAADLVDLIRRPRPMMVSSPGVRFGLWLTLSFSVRRALGTKMAATVRRRLGLPVFSESPRAADIAASPSNGEGAKQKTKPARRAKDAASTVTRKRVARKTSDAKARRKPGEASKDDRPR
jgi:NAD(P)-dependent dehydrogenase (short-subunit alcohol dehydrogenase family)